MCVAILYICPGNLPDEFEELQALIILTRSVAGWLKLGYWHRDCIAIVLAIVFVVGNLQDTVKIVFGTLVSGFTGIYSINTPVSNLPLTTYQHGWAEPHTLQTQYVQHNIWQ